MKLSKVTAFWDIARCNLVEITHSSTLDSQLLRDYDIYELQQNLSSSAFQHSIEIGERTLKYRCKSKVIIK
jgi:hypothetical protein